jgi:hypothetical protein
MENAGAWEEFVEIYTPPIFRYCRKHGGGNHELIFGNNSAGLTPAQVAQIRFDYPTTQYPAKFFPREKWPRFSIL